MADFWQNSSTSAYHGFSVFQPALGAPLQWLPAIGTAELDDLLNAYLPGPASIQDKRAHIAMEYFSYSRLTGETFKFYPVHRPSLSTFTATGSPASSLFDSSCNSSFDMSPVVSDMGMWAQSPASFSTASLGTASTSPEPRQSSRTSTENASPSATSSSQKMADFTSHPGMRILTMDGRDVTHSAAKGTKTKEQRDHAHLMRIMKACDSCRKKKTRCDPSHRKQRNASQSSPAPQSAPKTAKKAKKMAARTASATMPSPVEPTMLATPASFAVPEALPEELPLQDSVQDNFDALWDQFMQSDEEVAALANTHSVAQNYDFAQLPLGNYAPTQPQVLAALQPTLPYLSQGNADGSNYVDFTLFSPASSFLDEEPTSASASPPRLRSPGQGLQQQQHLPMPSTYGNGYGGTDAHGEQYSSYLPQDNVLRLASWEGGPNSGLATQLSPDGAQRVPGLGQSAPGHQQSPSAVMPQSPSVAMPQSPSSLTQNRALPILGQQNSSSTLSPSRATRAIPAIGQPQTQPQTQSALSQSQALFASGDMQARSNRSQSQAASASSQMQALLTQGQPQALSASSQTPIRSSTSSQTPTRPSMASQTSTQSTSSSSQTQTPTLPTPPLLPGRPALALSVTPAREPGREAKGGQSAPSEGQPRLGHIGRAGHASLASSSAGNNELASVKSSQSCVAHTSLSSDRGHDTLLSDRARNINFAPAANRSFRFTGHNALFSLGTTLSALMARSLLREAQSSSSTLAIAACAAAAACATGKPLQVIGDIVETVRSSFQHAGSQMGGLLSNVSKRMFSSGSLRTKRLGFLV